MLFPPRNLLKIVYPLEAPHLLLYTGYLTIIGRRVSLNTRISFRILTILRRLMGRLRDKIYQKELENFDLLICVNKKTKKFYSELAHETELDVLPIGIFPNEFPYCPIVEKRSKIIFTTGNHIQRKGFQYLIQAMPSIIKEADVKLYIAGKGPYTEILKKLVEKLNLNKKVVFTGFVIKKKLINLYRMCDVFVHHYCQKDTATLYWKL